MSEYMNTEVVVGPNGVVILMERLLFFLSLSLGMATCWPSGQSIMFGFTNMEVVVFGLNVVAILISAIIWDNSPYLGTATC
jgi:hypothetical protein